MQRDEILDRALAIVRHERAERERMESETAPGNPFKIGSHHWRVYNNCDFAKKTRAAAAAVRANT